MSTDEQERRIQRLERDADQALAVGRRAHDAAIVQGAQVLALQGDITELRAEMISARAGVRTLVLVLVGFAFTVAGSAVTLALTLGGPG